MILSLPVSMSSVVVLDGAYPVFDLAVTDWIMNTIALLRVRDRRRDQLLLRTWSIRRSQRLIANEKVQVFSSAFH